MALPSALRRRTPNALRDHPRVRALALGAGLIPPRTMHSPEEAALLAELARGRQAVVEIGVYEGSSAIVLARALGADADLHLVDPFVDESGWALPAGWGASASATRRAVERAVDGEGARLHWHIQRSQELGLRLGRTRSTSSSSTATTARRACARTGGPGTRTCAAAA